MLFHEFKRNTVVIWKFNLPANCYLKDSVGNFKSVVFTSLDLRSEDWDFKVTLLQCSQANKTSLQVVSLEPGIGSFSNDDGDGKKNVT